MVQVELETNSLTLGSQKHVYTRAEVKSMVKQIMDERFVFRVADYMLPRPRSKKDNDDFFDDDCAENVYELDFITGGFKCC